MSMLNDINDLSAAQFAVQRSIGSLARGVFRIANNFIAAIIAQRERQAALAVLRSLSDRELADMGLSRNQIAGGLAVAAQERAKLQEQMMQSRL
jgi:uncharacterized protein YjiS (DUF1127 family)